MDLLDAQPEFNKSPWDYLDALVSDERIARGRELLAQYALCFRRGRARLRRRSSHRRGDLGRRIELRHHGRRPFGAPLDGDARLRRPPPRLFPRRIPVDARYLAARRRQARTPDRLLGRRLRPDPVHADDVQALRRRLRWRWPSRRGRFGRRCHRFDVEQFENGRMGRRSKLGLRGRAAAKLQLSPRRSLAPDDRRPMASPRNCARRRQAVSARRPIVLFCCCLPVHAGPPF